MEESVNAMVLKSCECVNGFIHKTWPTALM